MFTLLSYRSLLTMLFASLSLCMSISLAQAKPFTVQDLAGREITFEQTPKRVILGDSRYLNALSVLLPQDPTANIAAMLSDLKYIDFGTYIAYRNKFPNIDSIPIIGKTTAHSFSVEKAIALGADLAIFSLDGHGPNARHGDIIAKLEKAGVRVVFIDFRKSPLANTPKSIRLLGQIFGKSSQADRFLDFYQQELDKVRTGLSAAKEKQRVFIHSRVGVLNECCETMVRGMMADFVDHAGGENIAKSIVPGSAGVMNLEYLLTNQPDVYIATAVGSKGMPNEAGEIVEHPYVMLGAGTPEADARISLRKALERENLQHLDAAEHGRAHAIWHGFYNSPLNVAAVQRIAKWLYPELFADLDPEATLARIFTEFQAIDQTGAYWVSITNDSHD